MAAAEENATDILGFKVVISIAALVGLVGGLLFGIWDSVSVITHHTSSGALGETLFLFLYSMGWYMVIGCLGMVAIGVAAAGLIHIGKYRVGKSQLAGDLA